MEEEQLYGYMRSLFGGGANSKKEASALASLCLYIAEQTLFKGRKSVGSDELITQVLRRPIGDIQANEALKRRVSRIKVVFRAAFSNSKPSKAKPHLSLSGGKRGYSIVADPRLSIPAKTSAPAFALLQPPSLPLTRVRIEVRGSEIASLEIVSMNARAREYYGLRPGSDELIGANLETLLARLKAWMDKGDFDKAVADQRRAARQFAREKYAVATVPARFNSSHPNEAFKNKSFLSVITKTQQQELRDDVEVYFALVLYLDLDWAKDI